MKNGKLLGTIQMSQVIYKKKSRSLIAFSKFTIFQRWCENDIRNKDISGNYTNSENSNKERFTASVSSLQVVNMHARC